MVPVEKRILVKVANMYYIDNMKQSDIAKQMGVDRTTISKYLKRAVDQGIVKISVDNDVFDELERALEKRFGLKEAYIVPKSYDMQVIKRSMGQAAVSLLKRIVEPGQTIGLAWGTSIKAMIEQAKRERIPQMDVDIVPLDGGPENIESEYHVNTLCFQLAHIFGGNCHYIYAPVLTRTAEIRNAILQDKNYEKISAMWEKLNIGIVGIGAPVKSSNLVWSGDFGREAIESIARTGAVGEICSIFYDINGRAVRTEFTDRTIAIELDKLRNLEYSIAMAASREKVPSILGALRGKLVNVLITDEQTAKILLNE